MISFPTTRSVGYYNRAPDPEGLNFWIAAFDNGFDLDAMAEDFSSFTITEALVWYNGVEYLMYRCPATKNIMSPRANQYHFLR